MAGYSGRLFLEDVEVRPIEVRCGAPIGTRAGDGCSIERGTLVSYAVGVDTNCDGRTNSGIAHVIANKYG